jgi:hypothetical protein
LLHRPAFSLRTVLERPLCVALDGFTLHVAMRRPCPSGPASA